MIKLKDLLSENAKQDFTFSWRGKTSITVYTSTSPKVEVFTLTKSEGFGGVNQLGRSYSIQYKGQGYDLNGFFNQREIKKMVKDGIKRIEKDTKSLEKNLKYADHGAYGQDKREIKANKNALKILKKYK